MSRWKLAGALACLLAMQAMVSGQVYYCEPGAQRCVICPQPMGQVIVSETVIEAAAVRATTPHVRCLAGNSCGSGTICGATADGAYVLSNAHVWGTEIGKRVRIDCVTSRGMVTTSGTIVFSGYSSRRMVDFAIAFAPGLSSDRYMPLLKTEPTGAPFRTTGSPRCVWPQVSRDFRDARNYGDGLITGTPNAIGGQSGSAIYNAGGQQIALLTWSINGRCAGQKTSKLWQVATTRNVLLADPRPEGLQELGCADVMLQEGVFGSLAGFSESAVGDRPITEDVIASEASSGMEDLPIWVVPGQPEPEPEPEPEPDPEPDSPCPEGCMKVSAAERDLVLAFRAILAEQGDRAIDWRAIDWAELIRLIMEFVAIIQGGK